MLKMMFQYFVWLSHVKTGLTGKDSDAEKDRRQEEKGMTAEEMIGWHYRLNGHDFEQAPGDGEGKCAAVHGVTKSWALLSN